MEYFKKKHIIGRSMDSKECLSSQKWVLNESLGSGNRSSTERSVQNKCRLLKKQEPDSVEELSPDRIGSSKDCFHGNYYFSRENHGAAIQLSSCTFQHSDSLPCGQVVRKSGSCEKGGASSHVIVDSQNRVELTDANRTNISRFEKQYKNRTFSVECKDVFCDAIGSPNCSDIPHYCYNCNIAQDCLVQEAGSAEVSHKNLSIPSAFAANEACVESSDNSRLHRRKLKETEIYDSLSNSKEHFESGPYSDDSKPSSPLVKLKRFLSSKKRTRNCTTSCSKSAVTEKENLYSGSNQNIGPVQTVKRFSQRKLKKKSSGLIDCCSVLNHSKEVLSSLHSLDNKTGEKLYNGEKLDGNCHVDNKLHRAEKHSVTLSGSDQSPASASSRTPSVRSDFVTKSREETSTSAVDDLSVLSSESHKLYADDTVSRSEDCPIDRKYCSGKELSGSETFCSCFSELEGKSYKRSCDIPGIPVGRSDSFITCYQDIPTLCNFQEYTNCIYKDIPEHCGDSFYESSVEIEKHFQRSTTFNNSNCDKTIDTDDLNHTQILHDIPSTTSHKAQQAVCSQRTVSNCSPEKVYLETCSLDKLTVLSEGIKQIDLDNLTGSSGCSPRCRQQTSQGLSIVSSSQDVLGYNNSDYHRQTLCSVNGDIQGDIPDSLGATVNINQKEPQTHSSVGFQQVCQQCEIFKQRLEDTRKSLEKPLKALKSFLEELVQKIHRSGALCTGSPSWYNSSEGEPGRGEGLKPGRIFSTRAVDGDTAEEFDLSSQDLEYQLENGVWADSRSSLKALYDYEARSLCFDVEEDLDCETIIPNMQEEETDRVFDSGQTLTTSDPRQACSGGHVNRKNSVREWLQSIGNGSESLGEQDKLPAEAEPKQDHNANFEDDDLFLGAEAKLIDTSGTQGKTKRFESAGDKENLPEDLKTEEPPAKRKQTRKLSRTKTVDYPATPAKRQGHVRRFSLQQRFPFIHADSFQSNDSGKTYSSVNEILQDRTSNPFQILSNLGFGSGDQGDELCERIPLRFLTTPSQAQGIELDDFLKKNPQLKEQVLKQETLGQPFSTHLDSVSKTESSESSVDQETQSPEPVRRNSLYTVARNVILLKRFSTSLPQTKATITDYPQANVHEGITTEGTVYQSILHPDNTEFFAKQGLYDHSLDKCLPPAATKGYKLSKLTKTDSIKEDPDEIEDRGLEVVGSSEVNNNNPSNLPQVGVNTETAQVTPSQLTPKILVDEGSGCSDYYTGDPIRRLRKTPELDQEPGPKLTLIGKTPSPAGYRQSVSTYGTSPYDALRSPPLFPYQQGRTGGELDSTQQTDELETTTELGSLEIVRGSETTNQVGHDKTSPILCLEQEFRESHAMECIANDSSLSNGFRFAELNGHSPVMNPVSESFEERDYGLGSLTQKSNNSQPSDSDHAGTKEYDALSTASMPSILDDDIFVDTRAKDSHSDYSGLTRPKSLKLPRRNMSWAGDGITSPAYSSGKQSQARRDRFMNLRSKWQSSSHFSEHVESPLSDYSHLSATPEREFVHPASVPANLSDGMFHHDWEKASETSSDFGAESFMDRLQRIKDQHEIERDSQLEITMSKLGKVLREVSNAPEKLDDPVFMNKLKKECAKEPSYLEKLQKLKSQHEHKKRLHFEREFAHDNPYLEFQANDHLEDFNRGAPTDEPQQRTSLFDRLISVDVAGSETGNRTNEDAGPEQADVFSVGEDVVVSENLTDADQLLTGVYTDRQSEHYLDSIEVNLEQSLERSKKPGDDDPTEVKDIVHLKGLTDDVLEILRQSIPQSISDNDDDNLSQNRMDPPAKDNLLDFTCANINVPSAIEMMGEKLESDRVSASVDPELSTGPMQICDTSVTCDKNPVNSVDETGPVSDMLLINTKPNTPEIVITDSVSTDFNKSNTQENRDTGQKPKVCASTSKETPQKQINVANALKLKEQKRLGLQDSGKKAESFELEEVQSADIEVDPDTVSSDLPNIKQSRGLLLRTGSAQSDSSGFADSVDSHSVAEVNWDSRRVKQHTESGIETSSERTDTTVVTVDSYSRQSSSTSSNTVTDITPLPDESRSGTLSSTQTLVSRAEQASQIFLPQANLSDFEDANNNSGDVFSREENYEFEKEAEYEDLVSRKKKLTTSRGHLHTKSISQLPVCKTASSEEDGNLLGINKVVEEVEFDLLKQTVQEESWSSSTQQSDLYNDRELFPDRQKDKQVQGDSDFEVAEIEVDLYTGSSQELVSLSDTSLSSPNIDTAEHFIQTDERIKKDEQRIAQIENESLLSVNKDGQADDNPSNKSHDLRSLMLGPIDSLPNNKSSQSSAKSVKSDPVSPAVGDSDNNAVSGSGHLESDFKHYEFPKIRLAEKRKDIIQKGRATERDTIGEGFAVPYKPEAYAFEDLQPSLKESGETLSNETSPRGKAVNYNSSYREVSPISDIHASSDEKANMKLKRNVSAPGEKPKVFHPEKHNSGLDRSDYKQYDFPKIRLGERRGDIKTKLKDKQVSEETEEPLIILSGKEAPVDVEFPESYDRDRFRSKSKEIVAEAITSAKEKLKQEEKASKKKKRFPWVHNKDKPKHQAEKEKVELPEKVKKESTDNIGWQKTYAETYALENWEPDEQKVPETTVSVSSPVVAEEETPVSSKKSWFFFKSGTKNKEPSPSKPPSSSKTKEDKTSHALRKNADFVFKATLSPFRRIWTMDDQKAESVEESSLKKQMEKSDESADMSSLGSSGVYQEDYSNDVSLADELREYDAPEQAINVIELKISPKTENRPKTISKEQFLLLVGDEEDYDEETFDHEGNLKDSKPLSVCSEDSDTFAIDLEHISDLESEAGNDGEMEDPVSEDQIQPTKVEKKLETLQIFDDHVPNIEEVSDNKGNVQKDIDKKEAEDDLKAWLKSIDTTSRKSTTVKYVDEVLEQKNQLAESLEQNRMNSDELYLNDDDDYREEAVSLEPPEMYIDNQRDADIEPNPVNNNSAPHGRPSWAMPDHVEEDMIVRDDAQPSHSVLDVAMYDTDGSSSHSTHSQTSQSSSESSVDKVEDSPLVPAIMKPSGSFPRQDSLLDKFFENPTFESHSESDENDGRKAYGNYNKPSIDDLDLSELGNSTSTTNKVPLDQSDFDRGRKLRTSTESDIEDLNASNERDYSFPNVEISRRSGSDMDDKCVGTDISDLSVLSQNSSETVYSKKMVVSKLSFEPQKRVLPVNDVAELILIIDNGEIKEVKSVESPREKREVLVGVDKAYDLSLEQQSSHKTLEYHSPPYEHVERKHNSRMSRDSGYASNFTSLSDPQYQDKHHSASVNVKVSQTLHGPTYVPVMNDGTVRSKVRSDSMDETDGMSMMSSYSDVSEHQVLSSMLKQSEYYGAQIEGIVQKSRWPLFSKTRALTKQNLVEEVKLMQHALQKYKMEFKSLQIRANKTYREHLEEMTVEEREALENVEELRTEILSEIVDLEKALAVRMRNIIAGTGMLTESGPLDLASLHIISQMIEVLKEQVYHSNVVHSMCDPGHSTLHPLMVELESSSSDHDANISGMRRSSSLIDHLALLQSQLQAQQSQQAAVLNGSLRELKSVLLDEIRSSIQSETQELKCKLENTETQLCELKEQMSRGGTPHNLSQEMIQMDFDVKEDGLREQFF